MERGFGDYALTVSPSRAWALLAALKLCQQLHLLPPLDLSLCTSAARGKQATAPQPFRQLWFHPADLPIVDTLDPDFACAAHLCFDLMLRGGQLDAILVKDVDLPNRGLWCPPHKNVPYPYFRQPSPSVWDRLVALATGKPPDAKLFKRTSRTYSQLLADLTERLFSTRFGWHSLRRGGATTRVHNGQSIEDVRRLGCWTSESAITHYVFPWSSLPLRTWRSSSTYPPTTASISGNLGQPPSQLHHRPTPTRVRRPRAGGHGRLRPRQAPRAPSH